MSTPKKTTTAVKKDAHGKITEKVDAATNEEISNLDKKENVKKPSEKIKVRISRMVRSSFGAFNKGEIVELDSEIAEMFLKDGRASQS